MIDFNDKYELIYNIITSFTVQGFLTILTAFLLAGLLVRFIKYLR